MILRIARYAFFAFAASAMPAHSLTLDVLTACQDMKALYAGLPEISRRERCDPPRDRLGREFVQRTMTPSGASHCLVTLPSAQALARFACFFSKIPNRLELSCFARSDFDFDEYSRNYPKKYSKQISSYLDTAARCSVTNGQSSFAPTSLFFPTAMPWIARQQVAFVSTLGSTRKGEGYALHGFAEVDPTIRADSQIEFFILSIPRALSESSLATNPSTRPRVGPWSVKLNDDMADEFNRHYAAAPVRVKSISMDFKRDTPSDKGLDDLPLRTRMDRITARRNNAIRRIFGNVESGFEAQDFMALEPGDDGYEQFSGFAKNLKQNALDRMPYGNRVTQETSILEAKMLLPLEQPACARNNAGAVVAMLMAMRSDSTDPHEFGQVSLTIVGAGGCQYETRYMTRLLNSVRNHIFRELRSQ